MLIFRSQNSTDHFKQNKVPQYEGKALCYIPNTNGSTLESPTDILKSVPTPAKDYYYATLGALTSHVCSKSTSTNL